MRIDQWPKEGAEALWLAGRGSQQTVRNGKRNMENGSWIFLTLTCMSCADSVISESTDTLRNGQWKSQEVLMICGPDTLVHDQYVDRSQFLELNSDYSYSIYEIKSGDTTFFGVGTWDFQSEKLTLVPSENSDYAILSIPIVEWNETSLVLKDDHFCDSTFSLHYWKLRK